MTHHLSQHPSHVHAIAPHAPAAGPSTARAIRARGLIKVFEAGIPGCSARVRALNRVDIDLRPGDVVHVDGAPGAGKSTLLLVLAGMLAPDAGVISWTSESGQRLRAPLAVEYIPPWRASHAVQSLKRAVASRPGVLLLDDVLSHLDSVSRREARSLIRQLCDARVTLVLASRHDPSCMSLCRRTVFLHAGAVAR
jgi:ABC-type multidrug transport system ATPase subunit